MAEPSDEEFKRGMAGVGTDSFMENFKCRFCGQEMDEYAERFDDGEYTRSVAYQCINKECPGPPMLLKKKELLEWLKSDDPDLTDGDRDMLKAVIFTVETGRFDVRKK